MTGELEEVAYLSWALPRYGRVRFDLASSGAPPAPGHLLAGEVSSSGTSPCAMLANTDPGVLGRFQERLAPFLALSSTEVMPCLGTSQALWLACAVRLRPGDLALVERPTYEPLLRVAAGHGARIVRFDRDADGQLGVDLVLSAVATHRPRIVLISSPHNPTGAVLPDQELRRLGEGCADAGSVLLVDEVYRPFQTEPGTPWGSARRASDTIWAIGSLTKRFGLGYARAGWLAAPPWALRSAGLAMQHVVGQPGTLFAAAGLAAMERLPAIADAVLPETHLAAGRARVDAFVRTHSPALTWWAPPFGPFGFIRHRSGRDLRPTIESLADQSGVLVAPGVFFGREAGFRIGWTAPLPVLEEGLQRLSSLARPVGKAC